MAYKSKEKEQEYRKKYYREHKKHLLALSREWRRNHPENRAKYTEYERQRRKTSGYKAYARTYYQKTKARQKRHRETIKRETFMHYSNGKMECAFCGYNNIDALCIDHINNDGGYERKTLKRGSGVEFYRWLKSQGFPSGYQVLCCNCNQIKRVEYLKNR